MTTLIYILKLKPLANQLKSPRICAKEFYMHEKTSHNQSEVKKKVYSTTQG